MQTVQCCCFVHRCAACLSSVLQPHCRHYLFMILKSIEKMWWVICPCFVKAVQLIQWQAPVLAWGRKIIPSHLFASQHLYYINTCNDYNVIMGQLRSCVEECGASERCVVSPLTALPFVWFCVCFVELFLLVIWTVLTIRLNYLDSNP